jgi:hypothetical protein
MINYFENLGFGDSVGKALNVAQGVQSLSANKQAMQMNQANIQRQQQADQSAMLKFANDQQKQRAAQGAGAFYNALSAGDDQAALAILKQFAPDINSTGDPTFTDQKAAELMQTPEGKKQLGQMALGMIQLAAGPEQMARFTAQQAKPADPTDFEKFQQLEAQRAQIEKQQGPEAAARFATMTKLSTRPVSEVNVNMPQDKKISELDAKAFTQYSENAKAARKELNSIAALKPLSERAVSGTGASLLLTGGKLLNQLGFEVEGLTESEVFQQLANTLVLDKSQQMSGALSNADMTFLTNTVPTLSNTKEGRRLSLDMAERLAKRQMEIQNLAVKFRREAKQNGDDFDDAEFQQYIDQWAEENPLFDNLELPKTQAPKAAIDYLMQNPQFKAQFMEKYGYLPEGVQ